MFSCSQVSHFVSIDAVQLVQRYRMTPERVAARWYTLPPADSMVYSLDLFKLSPRPNIENYSNHIPKDNAINTSGGMRKLNMIYSIGLDRNLASIFNLACHQLAGGIRIGHHHIDQSPRELHPSALLPYVHTGSHTNHGFKSAQFLERDGHRAFIEFDIDRISVFVIVFAANLAHSAGCPEIVQLIQVDQLVP